MHLSIHDITADEYKDLYNIPYSYGLARETTRRMHSEAFKARLRDDPDLLPRMQKLIADNAEARKKGLMKARPMRDFIMDEYTQRALKNAGHETQFSDADKGAYLDAVSNGMTRNEAIESIGFCKTALYRNFKTDPAFKEMSSRALEAQPFHLQARQQSLGKRFEVECARLLAKGMSDHEIAAKLGVTAMSVNRRTKKMRRQKK
jgi:CRP-like cAMP-binding protein